MDPIAPGASTGGAKAASDDTSQVILSPVPPADGPISAAGSLLLGYAGPASCL